MTHQKAANQFCFILFWTMLISGLSGCTVGPDYVKPDTKAPDKFYSSSGTASISDRLLSEWWKQFNDPLLSELITRSVLGNTDVKLALARIKEARAKLGIKEADRFPKIGVTGAAASTESSKNTGTGERKELYSADFDAAWELDIFGGVRRSKEAAQASFEAAEADYSNVITTLTAETALNYIQVRTWQKRLDIAESNLVLQTETWQLTSFRRAAGLSSQLDEQRAKYSMEDTRSRIPSIKSNLDAAKNRLAVLIGNPPGMLHHLLSDPKPIPVVPVEIAVGVPADVIRRRPDIRRAERNLAAQTAQIGVTAAQLYPKFTLSGSIGLEALSLKKLISLDSLSNRIGSAVSWNIFDAGAIRRNIEVQNALQEQALIQYEASVLKAIEEVENALTAFAQDQIRRGSLLEAKKAAQQAYQLSLKEYQSGISDFQNVLETQRSLLSYEDTLADNEGAIAINAIKLYKSLGGGW